jgi:uncharacterized protein DUF2510
MEDDVDPGVLSRADEADQADDGSVEEAWRPDPEQPGQERFWDGYEWTDQVRPDGSAPTRAHLPEHTPELQRALAAATADIDAVEDRLASLFDRAEGRGPRVSRSSTTLSGAPDGSDPARPDQLDVNSASSSGRNADENWQELGGDDVVLEDFDEDPEEFEDEDDVAVHPVVDNLDEDDVLSDVDAALAAEAPEEF